MFGIVLSIVLAVVLATILRTFEKTNRLAIPLLAGYVLRLIIQSFIRDVPLFSHGIGGDYTAYESWAQVIAATWHHTGLHFITQSEVIEVGPTSLPPNLFALVIYLNDGLTRIGCTSTVAFAAAMSIFNIYTLSLQFGAREKDALLVAMLLYFNPTFVFYTSDMFKDGLVVCFTIGALASAIRLSFKLSALHAIIGLACIFALWYVRFYLVFVTVAPLLVGSIGMGSKSVVRPLLVALALGASTIALVAFTDILQLASQRASDTFQTATGIMVQANAASGGSSVAFDDGGSPFGALGAKLAYMLFSPFPWASGSFGFHVGKLDCVLWYYLLYRAVRGVRLANPRLVIALATFIVPCTFMYAMSMANVGLIVRQRLVVVFATAVLAALYRTKEPVSHESVEDPRQAKLSRFVRAAQ